MIHNEYVRGGQHVVPVAFSWGFCLLIAFLHSRQVISHHLTWPSPILYGKTWVKAGPSRHPGGDEKNLALAGRTFCTKPSPELERFNSPHAEAEINLDKYRNSFTPKAYSQMAQT